MLDTKLADRTSSQRGVSYPESTLDTTTSNTSTARVETRPRAASSELLAKLRQDLVEAQRSKGALQLEFKMTTEETQKLRAVSKADGKRITELTSAKVVLTTKLRDRDEELRGKAKLLEVCQSESLLSTNRN